MLCGRLRAESVFFQIDGLVYWGILARMQQTLERARTAAFDAGSSVTPQTGMRTREMRAWRSLGKAMTDLRSSVFNVGRTDFRKQKLTSYALEVQILYTCGFDKRALECGETC